MHRTLFEEDELTVKHDVTDSELPISVKTSEHGANTWLSPESARNLAVSIQTALGDTPAAPAAASWNEAQLNLAAQYDKGVQFTYSPAEYRSGPQVRHLDAGFAVATAPKSGHTLVVGYDDDRGEPRAFRLDRIAANTVAPR